MTDPSVKQFRAQVQALIDGGDLDAALEQASRAVIDFADSCCRGGRAAAHFLIGVISQQRQNSAVALENYLASAEIWQDADRENAAWAWLKAAGVLNFLSQNDEAYECVQRSIVLFRQTGDRDGEIRALNSLALIHKQRGEMAVALEIYLECLQHFEQRRDHLATGRLLANIANLYNILENAPEAIRFAARGIALFESEGRRLDTAMALAVIGTAYVKAGDFEEALARFERALPIAEEMGNTWLAAVVRGDIGDVLIRLKRYVEARDILEQALELRARADNLELAGELLTRLGTLYANPDFDGHSDATALPLLLEAQQITETSDSPSQQAPAYAALAQVYERQDDYRKALEYARLYHGAEKRLFNEASDRRIKLLELEKARTDSEIAQLRAVELANELKVSEELKAIANERAEYNRRIAETLQDAVLPALPDRIAPGLSVRALYRPASEEAAIGGDFYDAFSLPNGSIALVVGDVVGHGLAAALSIAKVRFALRAFILQNPADIGETLTQLNNFLIATSRAHQREDRSPDSNRLVALTLLTIDPVAGELRITAAGMEAAILLRSGPRQPDFEYLDAGDLVLGAMPNVRYEAKAVPVYPGDLVAITTDGITEAFSLETGQQFGLDGLRRSLRDSIDNDNDSDVADLSCLGESALSAVRDFVGGPFRDDVCLLLTRIEGRAR